jgi:hypothetical protein
LTISGKCNINSTLLHKKDSAVKYFRIGARQVIMSKFLANSPQLIPVSGDAKLSESKKSSTMVHTSTSNENSSIETLEAVGTNIVSVCLKTKENLSQSTSGNETYT